MKLAVMKSRKAAVVAGIAALAAACGFGGALAAGAATAPLVYICPDSQGTTPTCTNAQEFEVFDHNGAPIFSVPEYGGPAVFGDNLSVHGTDVFNANTTISWESPATYYGKKTCTQPSGGGGVLWIDSASGGEFWTCTQGVWVRHVL